MSSIMSQSQIQERLAAVTAAINDVEQRLRGTPNNVRQHPQLDSNERKDAGCPDLEEMDFTIETNMSFDVDPEVWSLIQTVTPQTPKTTAVANNVQQHASATSTSRATSNDMIQQLESDAGCSGSEEMNCKTPSKVLHDSNVVVSTEPSEALVDEDDKVSIPLSLKGPPGQIFEKAFNMMTQQLLGLRDVAVRGANMTTKDIQALASPRWYTDGIIDAVCRIATKDLDNDDSHAEIFYQDAVAIITHIPQSTRGGTAHHLSNQQQLLDWCSKLRTSSIQPPGARWACGRMSPDCSSVVFAWSPFNDHWVAVQILKEGRIMIWDSFRSFGPASPYYAQQVLPLYADLVARNPSNDWDAQVFANREVEFM
jgi:hypothetical protein